MTCRSCRKRNPSYATVCVRCGTPLNEDEVATKPSRKKAAVIITAIVAVVAAAAILLCMWLCTPSKASLVGTWQMKVPVGEALAYFSGNTEEESPLLNSVLELLGEGAVVTVYCRFYDNDTYTLYADSEEIIAVADNAIDVTVEHLCNETLFDVLEKKNISESTVKLALGLLNTSLEDLENTLRDAIDDMMVPLYDKLKTALVPDEETGQFRYLLENKNLYMGLQKDTPIDESVYVIWQFDGDNLQMSSGTFFDTYLGELTWVKAEA